MILSRLANSMTGSEIVKLGNQIKERIRLGEKIYNYTIGDFDSSIFPIPHELEEAIVEAYRNKQTTYPTAEGILELRESISAFIKRYEQLEYSPSEIQVASGGRPLIYSIFKVLVDKGDKVIYAVPSWNNNHYTHFNEGEHVVLQVKPEQNFMPTAADIKPHIQGATLICLCTPQNPTGTMIPKHDLEAICDLILEENARRTENEKKLYLMFDQMYWTLTFGQKHYNPVGVRPAMRPYTLYVDGISKVFAATGVRVGWSMGPEPIIAKIKALLTHVGAWAPMAEQKATASYLSQFDAMENYFEHFKKELEYRLTHIAQGFKDLKAQGFAVDSIDPQGAIYVTIKLDLVGKTTDKGNVLQSQNDVTQYILEEAKLAIVPFYCFGADPNSPWYRISIGTVKKDDIPLFLDALKQAMIRLK